MKITRSSSANKPLTISQCREMMGWHDKSDKEVEEFLSGLRKMIGNYLDDYFNQNTL